MKKGNKNSKKCTEIKGQTLAQNNERKVKIVTMVTVWMQFTHTKGFESWCFNIWRDENCWGKWVYYSVVPKPLH